jgi:hypothetical protein
MKVILFFLTEFNNTDARIVLPPQHVRQLPISSGHRRHTSTFSAYINNGNSRHATIALHIALNSRFIPTLYNNNGMVIFISSRRRSTDTKMSPIITIYLHE